MPHGTLRIPWVGQGPRPETGDATLSNSTVSGNSNSDEYSNGGGLYIRDGDATLSNSTVSGNSTSGDGGGLFIGNGDATLSNSTVSGNSTTGDFALGGGLRVVGGNATLSNSTVSGNSTTGYAVDGGGLSLWAGNATLTHSTVAYNTASYANATDGVHRNGTGALTLNNSLIVQGGSGETACNAAAVTQVNSLATDISCTGTATDLADISLGPLVDNGGPTLTHALGDSSVAINAAGDCLADFGVDQDQRGQPRPRADSAECDIGAYEFHGELEITVSTGSLDFGDLRVGAAAGPLSVSAENIGTGNVDIGAVGPITGADAAAFSLSNDGCTGMTLAAAQTCTVELTFSPGDQGDFSASFDFVSDAVSSPDTVNLTGTGVASIIGVTPALLDFGTVPWGSVGGPLDLTVGNSGDEVLNVTGLSALAAPFGISLGTCGATPFSLPPGEDCLLSFTFVPTDSDPVMQTVTIESDSFGGTDSFTLQGSSTPPPDDIFEDRFED